MAYNEKLFPGSLRIAALIALLAGGAGSVVLVLRAGQRTPAFLLAIMVVWVLAPRSSDNAKTGRRVFIAPGVLGATLNENARR